MILRTVLVTLLLLALSALGGLAAQALGTPLPFMLGPLIVSGLIATALPERLPEGYKFPDWLRNGFITIIGLLIGARVTPELFGQIHGLAASLLGITVFVALAQGWNYVIFRKLGRYDRATAYYSGSPGGLYESIALGEEAGADLSRLMLQQFLRIIIVVTLLPLALSLYEGQALGSAAGAGMGAQALPPLTDLALILAGGLAGQYVGKRLHIPAAQIIGPLLVAATLSLTGLLTVALPGWLVQSAQLVVGTALGLRFTGLSRKLMLSGIGLSLVSVGGMLAIGALFAWPLRQITGESFEVMLICFAPGGVTEMALVALSLHANPAFVTLHHVYRIIITVLGLTAGRKILSRHL